MDMNPTDATPTLLKLKTMRGADGKPLKIIQTIAAGDYITFGMCLLQDENGMEIELIEKDHKQDGVESVTQAILKKWLTSGATNCTYQHLIECLRQSELGTLADNIASMSLYMLLYNLSNYTIGSYRYNVIVAD